MILPAVGRLASWTKDLVDECRVSASARQALARTQKMWLYTGNDRGNQAIYNKLIVHCDKLASSLFAPTDLRFFVEYENDYGAEWTKRGKVAGRYLSREFNTRDFDLLFGNAVFESLPHGSCFLKLGWGNTGPVARMVMPWNMGVYREDVTELDKQEAIVETFYITEQEFWRRVSHRSDARELLSRAQQQLRKRSALEEGDTYIHQVILAGTAPVIGTPDQPTTGSGGFVQLSPAPSSALLSPDVAAGLMTGHEIYVVNDATGDYTTIQMIEPDIIIAPRLRRENLFVEHDHPYIKVEVNPQSGYMWGRSELADLIKLQSLLRDRIEDVKRIMSLQFDRIRAFIGFSGMNDERYDQLKNDGWIAEAMPGAKIEDLTPPMPENWREEIKLLDGLFDSVAGMDGALSGKGEPGVRAGNHFQGMLRTASPRLRDRALRAERQCAEFAEKMLWLMAAKDPRSHWTQSHDVTGVSDFYLSQLPTDTRVLVDSHSSSPIYEQDHATVAAFLYKAGAIDGEDLLDLLPVPNRDTLQEKYRERQAQKQQFLASLPPQERLEVMLGRPAHHGGHHG